MHDHHAVLLWGGLAEDLVGAGGAQPLGELLPLLGAEGELTPARRGEEVLAHLLGHVGEVPRLGVEEVPTDGGDARVPEPADAVHLEGEHAPEVDLLDLHLDAPGRRIEVLGGLSAPVGAGGRRGKLLHGLLLAPRDAGRWVAGLSHHCGLR